MRWLAFLLLPLVTAVPAAQVTLSKPLRSARIRQPNIVLVVMDDVGVDKVSAYNEGPPGVSAPCTPNLDALAASGLLFRNAWANAICSPTRAQILTGRHSFRTGIGRGIPPTGTDRGLNVARELILPMALPQYDSSAIGKWHLMSPSNGTKNHPLDAGFGWFAGSLFNLRERMAGDPDCGGLPLMGYTNWIKYEDPGTGALEPTCWSEYATTDSVDDAVLRAQTMQEPWFLYVALHAAHDPFDQPPTALCPSGGPCTQPYCASTGSDPLTMESAIVEAMDQEFGRMLAGIQAVDPQSYVFVIGDNGTPGSVSGGLPGSCFDPERGKGTPYESGVRVPLLVKGPDVVVGECTALVCATDLFATVTELAQVAAVAEDSVSLVPYLRGNMSPLRQTVYSELFLPNQRSALENFPFQPDRHLRTVRNTRYKLIRVTNLSGLAIEEFYDLQNDPCEQLDLCVGNRECDAGLLSPDAQANYLALKAELAALGVD